MGEQRLRGAGGIVRGDALVDQPMAAIRRDAQFTPERSPDLLSC
jgi:hypothetical protein